MTGRLNPLGYVAVTTMLLSTPATGDDLGLPPVGPDDLAFSIENMDTSVDPAEDFYRYAVGRWLDRVERPEKYPSYGIFTITDERVKQQLAVVVPAAARATATAPKGSPTQLVGDFYNAYMDVEAIDAAGIDPIREELDRIDAIASLDDLVAFLARQPSIDGVNMLVSLGHSTDPVDSTRYAMFVSSPSFGIIRSFETILADPPAGPRLAAYRAYLAEMLEVAGYDAAEADRVAALSVEIERTLFAGKLTPVEGADPRNHYNPMTLAEVQAQIPELDLSALLEQMGYPPLEQVVLYEPRYLPVLSELLRARPLAEIKDYAKLRMILEFSPVMSTAFEAPNRRLGEALVGVGYTPPREERAFGLLAEKMAHPLGQVYVEAALPDATRALAEDMIDRIEAAFIERLPGRDWLTEETRAEALAKAEAVSAEVGGPDEWIDYSSVEIGPDTVANRKAIGAFEDARSLARWDVPVVHEGFNAPPTWPTTVNAAYTPSVNGFEVPTAILQAPFFQEELDAPVYFCRLGGIIGRTDARLRQRRPPVRRRRQPAGLVAAGGRGPLHRRGAEADRPSQRLRGAAGADGQRSPQRAGEHGRRGRHHPRAPGDARLP